MRTDPDAPVHFAAERCRFPPGYWTSSAELHAAYRAWCTERGLAPQPRVSFSRFLALIGGVEPHRYAAARGYRGVRLL